MCGCVCVCMCVCVYVCVFVCIYTCVCVCVCVCVHMEGGLGLPRIIPVHEKPVWDNLGIG